MSKHDQAALDAATQIIDLFSSPGQWRDTWHLKHKVQCLLIDLLERNATQPATGEPVAIANRGKCAFWVRWTDAAEGLYGPGIKLYAAPPAAAHGDEAVRIKLPDFILCSDEMHERGKQAVERAIEDQCFGRWTQFKVYFEAAIEEWLSQQEDAAMRAQGDGGSRDA